MESFATLGPLQFTGIVLVGIFLTVLALFFLLRDQKSIKAADGTLFSTEEARLEYEAVLERLSLIYLSNDNNSPGATLEFQRGFLDSLKEKGFADAKALIKYRNDFKKLVVLFDQEIVSGTDQ